MIKKVILVLLGLGLWSLPADAQTDPDNPNSYTALSARVLTLDYGTPNDLDYSRTFGLEASIRRQFGKYLALALPGKIGVIDIGQLNNVTFIGADLQLQLYPFTDQGRLAPYLLGGAGVVTEEFKSHNYQIPVGAGINIQLGDNSYITGQFEWRMSNQLSRDNLQASLGYTYRISSLDRDRDGIADSEDACPEEPGSPTAAGCPDRDSDGIADRADLCPDIAGTPATQGCPDTDGDGLADLEDACPDRAGTINGCPDQDEDGLADNEDSCPTLAGSPEDDGCPDSDGDGIHDGIDLCPDQAAPGSDNGCPLSDQDGDGVPDNQDACPTEAGTPEARGCPDQDGDGVADADDRCPTVAGPYTGCPDSDGDGLHDGEDECPTAAGTLAAKGCPEIERQDREVLAYAMQAVQFETGSARLRSTSYDVLDQVAEILERYPDYGLEISGHTDNVGDEDNNLRLSQDRAKACFDYLVQAGIQAERLSFTGYGETRPRASNDTAVGRRRNRRVEFDMTLLPPRD
jgi:outer membrane protein OmpA-like peptidoglycan-associated protein